MTKQETCLVLMAPDFRPLGEALWEDGACRQVNLNQLGETLLGPMISDWQIQGLEHWRSASLMHGQAGELWQTEGHTLRSADFREALAAWLEDHGFHYVELPLGAMLAWSQIQNSDREPQHKYELAIMLRDLPVHKLVID